jgi:hypothetical protein
MSREEIVMRIGRKSGVAVVCIVAMAIGVDRLKGASVEVPNGSFESPQTSFVDVNTAPWQKGPTPTWYDESSGYAWSQLTGIFVNVPPSDGEYIDNCDGNQAVWLFAVPEAQLYQDLAATYEIGQSYHLSVGVIGGGGNMKDGVPLEIRLYYRDVNGVMVTAESTNFTYHVGIDRANHFRDVRLDLPLVWESDPWAGKHIGIQVISALTLADLDPKTGRAGGFWDLDDVRLTKTSPTPVTSLDVPNGSFESPQTSFVDVNTAPWQKGSTPAWYDESSGYAWSQLTGVFLNVPPTDSAYIDNCDGNQAVWLFAVPEAQLYQDLAATYEVGQCYHLSVGAIGGGGNMKDGVPLEVRLYYRDADGVMVTAESTSFTYHLGADRASHFRDIRLDLPVVWESDPWAGKPIGIQVISTLTLADLDPKTGRAGGFWDLDNVRLTKSLPSK